MATIMCRGSPNFGGIFFSRGPKIRRAKKEKKGHDGNADKKKVTK
jgi:hypothetical protein